MGINNKDHNITILNQRNETNSDLEPVQSAEHNKPAKLQRNNLLASSGHKCIQCRLNFFLSILKKRKKAAILSKARPEQIMTKLR